MSSPSPSPSSTCTCPTSQQPADSDHCDSAKDGHGAQVDGADPAAAALFEVAGVKCVMLAGDWLTVNKDPDAKWPPVKNGVKKVLAGLD